MVLSAGEGDDCFAWTIVQPGRREQAPALQWHVPWTEVFAGRLRWSSYLRAGVAAVAVFHGNVEVPEPENVVLAEEETVCAMRLVHIITSRIL